MVHVKIVDELSMRNGLRPIRRPLSEANAPRTTEADATEQAEESAEEDLPTSGPLPPDLDLMDDQELQDHLRDLVREDGQVDMHELEIITLTVSSTLKARSQASPSTRSFLNILTRMQEIVDRLEVERLAGNVKIVGKKKKPKIFSPARFRTRTVRRHRRYCADGRGRLDLRTS